MHTVAIKFDHGNSAAAISSMQSWEHFNTVELDNNYADLYNKYFVS